jgi:hypothetical protein
MRENKVLKFLVWTLEDGRPFGRHRHGMEYDVKWISEKYDRRSWTNGLL